MFRVLTALLICATAQAATSTANLTITATLSPSGTNYAATGTAALTGGIAATGTFSATLSAATIATGGASPFTITFSGGTLTGSLTIPAAVFTAILAGAGSASGASATFTSGTGTYAGDTGTFPNLSGSGGVGAGGITVTITGSGTVTTGGVVGPPVPTITAVLDAASNTANLAPGTIFIIKGSALCPGNALSVFSVPRPTTSPDGVSIAFAPAGGGSSTNALIWYEDPLGGGTCQLAGILPSSVAAGNYNVTVTNGTASAPFAATVVAHKFAMFTQDSTGAGLAVAQNVVTATQYDLNRLTTGTVAGTTISPAHPSQYMVAYGTGLGGFAGGDNAASPVFDFSTNGVSVSAVVGGTTIPVLFAGRAGYAGEDQINFQLPANVTTGCAVSFQISVNGSLSPMTTMSIAPAGAATCVLNGFTSAQLTALDNGNPLTFGNFSLTQTQESIPSLGTVKADQVSGGFSQITAFNLASLPPSVTSSTVGSCTVQTVTLNGSGVAVSGGSYLDAGAITLSGPTGTNLNNTALPQTNFLYLLTIGDEGINIPGGLNGTIVAGKYTLNGSGGSDVGAFNTSLTLGTPLSLTTPLPTNVPRNQPLVLSWTGGIATDPVTIFGYSGTTTGSGASAVTTATEFTCLTTAGTGGFTVPTSVLGQVPVTPASAAGGAGILSVGSGPPPSAFNATLKSSGAAINSTFSGTISFGSLATYQ